MLMKARAEIISPWRASSKTSSHGPSDNVFVIPQPSRTPVFMEFQIPTQPIFIGNKRKCSQPQIPSLPGFKCSYPNRGPPLTPHTCPHSQGHRTQCHPYASGQDPAPPHSTLSNSRQPVEWSPWGEKLCPRSYFLREVQPQAVWLLL